MITQLQQLGFSQYEAQAYIALLRDNPVSGYELAKNSGIPRPNIYPVLQKLEDRGAVLRLDTPDGARYSPLPPNDLLASLKQRYQASLDAVSSELQEIVSPPTIEYILNLRSYPVMVNQAITLVEKAQRHLLLSIWPEEAAVLSEAVQRAAERGVQITTLCLRGCPQPCPACRGAVFRYEMAPNSQSRWLVLVTDERELLAGEISPTSDTLAVLTRQSMLVNLSASYIQNSIALASIISGLGDRLNATLEPQVIAALNSLHPLHSQGQWLEAMQRMLHLDPRANQGSDHSQVADSGSYPS